MGLSCLALSGRGGGGGGGGFILFEPWFYPVWDSQGYGPVCSRLALLWYLLNPFFCEWARLLLRLELIMRKFSFSLSLLFSLLLSHSFSCYLTLAPSDFPQGIQAGSLPEAGKLGLPSSVWATSLLQVAIRRVFCVCVCVCFFPLLAMFPSEIPTLPRDATVRGFPGVWKLLVLHDSLPRTGLFRLLFYLSFCLLYFVLPPFNESGLPFWMSGVLHQRSEVVLWKLLSIQMIF